MEDLDQDNAELLALQRIDETCTNFQQNGQYLEALECMERGLVLRQHFFGAGSDEARTPASSWRPGAARARARARGQGVVRRGGARGDVPR
jgi:hypothetical protein